MAGVSLPQLSRIEAIRQTVAASGRFRALLGCGSTGQEIARMDRWSDLDLFFVVKPECAAATRASLEWLEPAAPIAWRFRFLDDAWKVLYADGVFAEFGIVTEDQLSGIPYAPARLIWAEPGFDAALCHSRVAVPQPPPRDAAGWANEAAALLLIALWRHRRGEILAAWMALHGPVMTAFLELAALTLEKPRAANITASIDPFVPQRRFEFRYPGSSRALARLFGSWEDLPQAARAMCEEINTLQPLDASLEAAIRSAMGA